MALVLTLHTDGDRGVFRLNNTRVELREVDTATRFKLRVIGSGMDTDYWITDRKQTQILPGVLVQAGVSVSNPARGMAVKVAIEAPANIAIHREVVYQKNRAAQA